MRATNRRDVVLRERLRRALRHCAGDDLCEIQGDDDVFLWVQGTTMIEATPAPDGSVTLRAFIALGSRLAPGDESLVAATTGELPLGHVVIEDDGDVSLVLRVPPATAPARLSRLVHALAGLADRIDDPVCAATGGTRAWDMVLGSVLQAIAPEPRADLA